MNYVKIENGKVINRAVFDSALPQNWPDAEKWHLNDEAQIGWAYDGTVFIPPIEPPPLPAYVRNQVFTQNVDYQDLLNNINSATPAQIKTYVTNNVTNLTDAKILLGKILLMIAIIARP